MIKEKIKCNKINKEAFIYYDETDASTFDNPNNTTKGLANGCTVLGPRNNICEDCEWRNK